ncbi:non-specific serine/threonine protein kinase [Entamoeba marina]
MSKEIGGYVLKDQLGTGAFSVVYSGVNKETNQSVAIKVIDTSKSDKDKLAGEINILKMIDHPNVIKLYDVIEGNDDKLYIITDLVLGGELFNRITDKTNYSEEKAKIVVKRLISAISYLHSHNIVHRDLKPENILLKSVDDDTDVRIADFGFSKMINEEAQVLLTACGTPVYVAPEVLNAKGYGMEVDMWSIGVITYVLLCGYPPFFGDTLGEILGAVLAADYDFHEEYWSEVSNEAIQFITNLLVIEPSLRLTAEEALEDPWLIV